MAFLNHNTMLQDFMHRGSSQSLGMGHLTLLMEESIFDTKNTSETAKMWVYKTEVLTLSMLIRSWHRSWGELGWCPLWQNLCIPGFT